MSARTALAVALSFVVFFFGCGLISANATVEMRNHRLQDYQVALFSAFFFGIAGFSGWMTSWAVTEDIGRAAKLTCFACATSLTLIAICGVVWLIYDEGFLSIFYWLAAF